MQSKTLTKRKFLIIFDNSYKNFDTAFIKFHLIFIKPLLLPEPYFILHNFQ